MLFNLLLYVISFLLIWFGAGLIVTSASKFSNKLKLSTFAFSFVFLGILTQAPEFSVGLQAVANNNAEIFVGNLLGGLVVLFLLLIPALAIFGNGICLKQELNNKLMLLTMFVVLLPSLFILDKTVTSTEGIIMIVSYLILLFIIERKNGILDKSNQHLLRARAYSYIDIIKLLLGLGIVFISSNLIVTRTVYFAEVFNISTFFIGLIIIAIGTDLPEIVLAVRSICLGKKELAIGDYVGGAAVTTFIFGLLTVLHNGEIITVNNFFITFIFILTALSLFYFFSRTGTSISRREGIVMILLYVIFLVLEITA